MPIVVGMRTLVEDNGKKTSGLLSWLIEKLSPKIEDETCCEQCGGDGEIMVRGDLDNGIEEWYNICPRCEGSGLEPVKETAVHRLDPKSILLALFIGIAVTSLAIGLAWFWAMEGALK